MASYNMRNYSLLYDNLLYDVFFRMYLGKIKAWSWTVLSTVMVTSQIDSCTEWKY